MLSRGAVCSFRAAARGSGVATRCAWQATPISRFGSTTADLRRLASESAGGRTGLIGAVAAGTAAAALSYQQWAGPTAAEEKVDYIEARVAALELEAGAAKHSAFVFIKPHAVYDKVKELATSKLTESGITVLYEGDIPAEKIDSKQLIDTHYGAIAAKAVKLKPDTLTVQPKAQAAFEKAFGLSWKDALSKGMVYNAMDACAKMGITTDELGKTWGTLKKDVNLLKFGGGFYCGKVGDMFVINGFYMDMRSKFTVPGTCIHFYLVEWSPSQLSWADFREKVLGSTDPKTAAAGSLRNTVYLQWQDLGLKACPDTGDNGVHASASPFEALAERNNWLAKPLTKDYFGKAMLAAGVPVPMLKAWCDDPAVNFEGKKVSLFDLLEDLDGLPCLMKSAKIAAENI